jgi:glycosyltransferase involved in cell wall biosynthesis
MKKILHFSNRSYSIDRGGTEVFLINLINKTKDQFNHVIMGEEIIRCVHDATGVDFYLEENPHGKVSSSKDRVKQILFYPFTLINSLRIIIKHWELFKTVDICSYSTGSRNSIINFKPIVKMLFPNIRHIFIHHGDVPEAKFYHVQPFKTFFVSSWNSMENVFICTSQMENYKRYGLKVGTVINNAVDIIPTTHKRDNKDFNVLFMGRLEDVKGILELLDSLQYLNVDKSKIVLNLGGNFKKSSIKDAILNKINNYNSSLDITINILGVVNPKEHYINSNCLICPSKSEGFSLTLIEAYSYGLPAITSNIPSYNEILNLIGDKRLVINPYTPIAIAEKIQFLYDNCIEFNSETYQINLNKVVRENYLLKDNINSYIKLFNKD